MAHYVIARKYRPLKFAELVGQEQVALSLKNFITSGKIPHALLFSGPRGVGKTTTARIFAKAINCESYPSGEPCGVCRSCREITEGNSVDVLEMDAASHRGIDQIRELKENSIFAPVSSRFKVFIIDEAHQITSEGFNAMLKILEEPPSHIVFILATTEPQKLPLTILSRCQHFRFSLVHPEKVEKLLTEICEKENVKASEDAIELICRASGGSLRDAESVLEQVISASTSGKIEKKDVEFTLGFVAGKVIEETFEAISKRDVKRIFEILNDVWISGFSIETFLRQILSELREILAVKISGGEPQFLKDFSNDRIFWMAEVLSGTLQSMKWSDFPRILAELAFYKILSDFVPVEEIFGKSQAAQNIPDVKNVKEDSSLKEKVMDVIKAKLPGMYNLIKLAEVKLEGGVLVCVFSEKEIQQASRLSNNIEKVEEVLRQEKIPLKINVVKPERKPVPVQSNHTEAKILEKEEPLEAIQELFGGGLIGKKEDV